jgi:hypothetical protein
MSSSRTIWRNIEHSISGGQRPEATHRRCYAASRVPYRFSIPQNAPIREVVETLILIWADDRVNDWKNLAVKIPLTSRLGEKYGATRQDRTGDPLITNEMLYQLS